MKEVVDEIIKLIPQDQWDEVMNQQYCEIEPVYMGFTEIYKNLSEIIPRHFVILDLGCAYAAQCFYFKNHKKYIGVDASDCLKFHTPNSEFHCTTINKYLDENYKKLFIPETFMICSYVPPWYGHDIKKVCAMFENQFTYYPHGDSLFTKSDQAPRKPPAYTTTYPPSKSPA